MKAPAQTQPLTNSGAPDAGIGSVVAELPAALAQIKNSVGVRPEPLRRYVRTIMATDAAAVTVAFVVAHLARFGTTDADLTVFGALDEIPVSYLPFSIIGGILWWLLLAGYHTYDTYRLGSGTEEYKRVASATLFFFGALAIGSYMLKVQFARSYFLVALPLGLVLLLLGRWLWRKWLTTQRARGRFKVRALLVGGAATSTAIAKELMSRKDTEFELVGACNETQNLGDCLPETSVPIVGAINEVTQLIEKHDVDTVIVTSSRHMTPKRLRELSWSLEPGRRHLVLAPSLVDVAGPRIHTRPVANLPLIHVETPRFDGRTLMIKRTFDIIASGLGLLLISPLLLLIAILVKVQDGGPVFFRQERVGRNGEHFAMLKFRSMVVDAEDRLAQVRAEAKAASDTGKVGNEVLFKMKDDPRVTRLGRVLRKYSIDELPQLVNVFLGDMSLIGPRPPLPAEVERYDRGVHRKFLVKPGITGLWQVSGRSNLSWNESVRLDLYYVENWSFIGDIQILFRTAKLLIKPEGAY